MQIADKDKFLAEAADPNLLATLGLQDKGIEGYLFPSTYHFTPSTPEKDIIVTMAEQFRKISLPLLDQREGNGELTPMKFLPSPRSSKRKPESKANGRGLCGVPQSLETPNAAAKRSDGHLWP